MTRFVRCDKCRKEVRLWDLPNTPNPWLAVLMRDDEAADFCSATCLIEFHELSAQIEKIGIEP